MPAAVSKFLVRVSHYPRYEYSIRHVTSMFKRYRVLLNDLKLEQKLEIPDFKDPEVYLVRDSKTSGFIQTNDLIQLKTDDKEAVKEHGKVEFKDIDTLVRKNHITSVSAKVIVRELNDVSEIVEQWIGYHENVILVVKGDKMWNETKQKLEKQNSSITLSTSETLGRDICFLLERIVFRRLSELVPELQCLSEVAHNQCIARCFEDEMAKRAKLILKDVVYFKTWIKEMETEPLEPQTSPISSKIRTKETLEAKRKVPTNQPTPSAADSSITRMDKESVVHLTEKFAAHMLLMAKQQTEYYYMRLPTSFRCMLPKDVQQKAVLSDTTFDKTLKELYLDLKRRIPETTVSEDNVDIIRKAFWSARKDIVSVLTKMVSDEGTFQVDDWIALIRKEEETSIKRMLWEITGMYNRSKVPEAERPKSPCFQGHKLNEKAAQHLFDSVDSAKGIGYRCDKLHIFVDKVEDMERHEQNKQIREALARYHITDYTITPSTQIVQHYKQVGAKIKVTRSGTLGGFAHMGENKRLCALLSKHVVNGAKLLYWVNNGDQVEIGSMIEAVVENQESASHSANQSQEETDKENEFVDVAAAKILEQHLAQCDTQFRDSMGRPRPCHLYEEYSPCCLAGLPVHIRGATTSLGHGTITANYNTRNKSKLIVVEDIDEGDGGKGPFCQEGDSGGVICADDPDGEFVDVISMLIGRCIWEEGAANSNVDGKYMTFRMDHGLQELAKTYGETFTLVA